MNFVKKNFKWIIAIIVSIIIASGISVYATNIYLASQVTYKNGKTVEYALNELYTKLDSNKQNNGEIDLNNYTELYSTWEAKPNASYTLNQQYSMVLIVVNGIGTGSGSEVASSSINVENNTKQVITLLNGDTQGYQSNNYKSSTSLAYMINPDIGTKINYSASYYGKVHIYALNNSESL